MSGTVWHIVAELLYDAGSFSKPPDPGEHFGQFGGRVMGSSVVPVIPSGAVVTMQGLPVPAHSYSTSLELRVEWHLSSTKPGDDAWEHLAGILEEVASCDTLKYNFQIEKESM